jgi:hypothetical protein
VHSAAIALSLADNKRGPLVITDEMLARASIPSYPRSTGRYNLDPRALSCRYCWGSPIFLI